MAMSDSEFHQKELQRHCRVCASVMEDHSRSQFGYNCQEQHNQSLLLKLGVNVMADQPDVHPTHFCHSCRTKASHHLETTTSSITPFDWKPHNSNCTTCIFFQKQRKGGRPKKQRKNRGRPQSQIHLTTQRLLHTTLPSYKVSSPLSPSRFLPSTTVPLDDFTCGLCQNIVDQPVETPCRKLVCSVCIALLLRSCRINHLPCPYCSVDHEVTETSFPEATDIVMKVLGDLLMKCENPLCTEVVALKNIRKHMAYGCMQEMHTFSPSKLTVGQILSCPLTSPPTTAERKAATSVVKRIIASKSGEEKQSQNIIKLPTAGQVSRYMHINSFYIKYTTHTCKHYNLYQKIISV